MDFSKWILFLCFKLGSPLEDKALAFIPEMSAVTLSEVWQMTGMSSSSPHIRSKRIDDWNWWTPLEVTLDIEDFSSKTLAIIRTNTTGSTNNLTDLLSFHKQRTLNPFLSTMPYHVSIGIDDGLIFADPNDISSVYFAHLRFNSTSTVNCFTKSGIPFSLTDAMNVLQNQKVAIYSQQFLQENGSTTLLIELHSVTQVHYMNGISVYNPNNIYTKYKVGYSTWPVPCQNGDYFELTSTFTYNCDGNVQDTGKISNVKAACVWIFFNESVTTVNITVFGPGDEPSTTSTNPSTTDAVTSSMTTTDDVIQSSDQDMHILADTTCEPCACDIYNSTKLSEGEIEEIQEKIKKELSVDVKNLSSTIRKKTSADDPRPSSTGIGYVGACIIAFTVGLIVTSDVVSVFKYFIVQAKMIK